MFSAVKIKGQKLYQAAREGIEVERPERPVTVHSFKVWREGAHSQLVNYSVECSKGTFIRSLMNDLVRRLMYVGHAHDCVSHAVECSFEPEHPLLRCMLVG